MKTTLPMWVELIFKLKNTQQQQKIETLPMCVERILLQNLTGDQYIFAVMAKIQLDIH